jgi:hypothetical protein
VVLIISPRSLLLGVGVAVAAAVLASTAAASCLATTAAAQRAHADVVLDGIALEGPTATGIQRFRIIRYRKGSGPQVARVSTGNIKRPDGSGSTTSVSIIVKRGQRWRIFARGSSSGVLHTSVCDGSRIL